MERRVDRIAVEPDAGLGIVQEGRGAERQLDDVMQELEARAIAEPQPELAEASRSEAVAAGQPDVLVVQPADDVVEAGTVVRVALEVLTVLRRSVADTSPHRCRRPAGRWATARR